MLDDFAHEMDTTDSKMDNVMKKMAKVLHMSNGRCWRLTLIYCSLFIYFLIIFKMCFTIFQ